MRSLDVIGSLREKQRELGLNQAELAAVLDVSEATISRLYSGKRGAGAAVIMGMLKLWPDVFSDNGGNDGDRKGDEHHGGDRDGGAGHPDHLPLPGAATR